MSHWPSLLAGAVAVAAFSGIGGWAAAMHILRKEGDRLHTCDLPYPSYYAPGATWYCARCGTTWRMTDDGWTDQEDAP